MELRIDYLLIFLGLAGAGFSTPVSNHAVKQFPLDERVVYEIPISSEVPTTVMFPSSLTALEGANITATAEQPAPVLLAYTPGRTFFSVRAVAPTARAAVNVVWKNKTYLLRFFTATDPFGSVTFYDEELTGGTGANQKRRTTPESLLALLDRAKSFSLLQDQYPEAAQQIEHASPGNVTLYRDFKVSIDEVFRFEREDTLVFRVRFENTSDREIIYQPQRLAVRVGLSVFYSSIADASGIVPAKAITSGYFAISGTPKGGRANLSVRNSFSVIVPRVDRDAKLIVPQ